MWDRGCTVNRCEIRYPVSFWTFWLQIVRKLKTAIKCYKSFKTSKDQLSYSKDSRAILITFLDHVELSLLRFQILQSRKTRIPAKCQERTRWRGNTVPFAFSWSSDSTGRPVLQIINNLDFLLQSLLLCSPVSGDVKVVNLTSNFQCSQK